jgi:N-acetylneuraminic acid mutarotase
MAQNGNVLGEHEIYNPATTTWVRKGEVPTAVANAAAAGFGGQLYIFGGQDANGEILSLVQIYDPATETWSTGPAMPVARMGAIALIQGARIFVIGGEGASGPINTMSIYTP